jgi:hypothetical protein
MANRYQKGNQKPHFEEGQTTQWPIVLLRFTASDYLFGICWPLCCLSFFGLRLLITLKGNQKPHFEEGQTTQWPKGTKKIIRSRNSKDRQHNGQKKKGQTTIYKTLHRKDQATRTPLENGDELRCSRRVSSSLFQLFFLR